MYCVCQRITILHASGNNIYFRCADVYRDFFPVACINTCRVTNRIFNLQMYIIRVDRNIIIARINACNYICLEIAKLVFANCDNGIIPKILRFLDWSSYVGVIFPDSIFILLCGGRSSAQFRRKSHHNGGDIAGDPVRINHCDLVEALIVLRCKVFCLPLILCCFIAVGVDAQCIAQLEPETFRVVFGVELAEPAFLRLDRSKGLPVLRMLRH